MSGELCQVSWIGKIAKVTLPAEVDIGVAAGVREELVAVVTQGAAVVIADMAATVFCDSAGVTALAIAHKEAASRGTRLSVVTGAAQVLRVLELTGLDLLIGIYSSEDEALAAWPSEARQGQVLAGEDLAGGNHALASEG